MCGISGFVDQNRSFEDLVRMQRRLRHRGPDASGTFFENGAGLAHNRLSIIDLSSLANQPFVFENLVLIFNGEIYNYSEIRQELITAGYGFSTHSDTEVLLKGYHAWKEKLLDKLIGMFAFAIYDKRSRELFLCRDRMGVKPMFYSVENGAITFASELKAFDNIGSLEIDPNGLSDYLKFGYTNFENTFYKKIKKLAPGHFLKFSEGRAVLKKYWDPADYILQDKLQGSEDELADQLEALMISSFNYRMVADVPVGVFFSGGVDSTALVALLSKKHTVNTFTIGFDDRNFDETSYARKIADFFKCNHTERILTVDEARDRLKQYYSIFDEPFYDSSAIPTSLVTQLAKESSMKVVLSSEGGDEMFAGYPAYKRFYQIGKNALKYPKPVRQVVGQATEFLDNSITRSFVGNKMAKFGQVLKSEDWADFYAHCRSTVTEATAQKNIQNAPMQPNHYFSEEILKSDLHPMELFMLWDIKYLIPNDYLVKVDRATMFHSVECREPFLDHRLIEFALRLPLDLKIKNSSQKYLLKKVLSRYITPDYFERPKMGFSVPLFKWFRSDLEPLIKNHLTPGKFLAQWPQVRYDWIHQELKTFNQSKNHGAELNMVMIWKFLGLMLWSTKYRSN